MKKTILILLAILVIVGVGYAATAKDPYAHQVKKLYSAPDDSSNLVYSIPIDVQLLDVSADANWYKVKIAFAFGPISYTYVGWAKIPVGDVLAARMDKLAKVTSDDAAEVGEVLE